MSTTVAWQTVAAEHVMPQLTKSPDGTEIAWYDFGGNGPDLLLGHATGFCAAVWAPVAKYLGEYFRCLAYDMRGHAMSARPQGGREAWDWSLYAQDAQAVLEASGVAEVFGVGHSCGGATEVLLEQQRPGTFRDLYLFEPVIFTTEPPAGPDPDRDLAVRARRRRQTFASRSEAARAFSERGPFVDLDPRCLDGYLDYGFRTQVDGSMSLRCQPDDEAEVYVMASASTAFTQLGSLKPHATVVRGGNSQAFSEEHMALVAARIPNGDFATMAGVGHFGPLEQPEAFARLVIQAFTGH